MPATPPLCLIQMVVVDSVPCQRYRSSGVPGHMIGVSDPGIEFLFPLDSRHILRIMERTHFAEWKKQNNKAVKLTPEQVQDFNGQQVKKSGQRVYCASDDFDLALSAASLIR
jgi:hypothetical protein